MVTIANHTAVERVRDLAAAVLETDASEVDIHARIYEDLEVDSLLRIELVGQLEGEFGIQLDPEEIVGLRTLADVVVLLRHRGVIADG